MCGIVAGLNERATLMGSRPVEAGVYALRHRGPDGEGLVRVDRFDLGHTRLSIIDVDPRSDQPFVYHGNGHTLTLVFNGEIWNYMDLRSELEDLGYTFHTEGDTEVVAALLCNFNPPFGLSKLQGMFAMAWVRDDVPACLQFARDRFGETPLHFSSDGYVASELKAFKAMGIDLRTVKWVPPGSCGWIHADGFSHKIQTWYGTDPDDVYDDTRDRASFVLRHLVHNGVKERMVADVPVCTLMSGGIDSAAVAFIASGYNPDLVAYTAVMDPRSPDLRSSREICGDLGIRLVEVKVEPPTVEDLGRVVRQIEMPHKAQVEIGWACLKLAEVIGGDGFKVVLSGEGSDELWASYGMAYHGVKKQGWNPFRHLLYKGQHRKNFARCNKIFMARGVECRLPFLNTGLAEYALGLPQDVVQEGNSRPKAVLQEAFRGLLPDSIVDRRKLAFQDAMGLKTDISERISDPKRLYKAEFDKAYRGVKS